MAQWWQGERKLFIKLLVAKSKLSKKDKTAKEGTEKIGSEKLPMVYMVKGKMEPRRIGMQDQRRKQRFPGTLCDKKRIYKKT